MHPRHPRADELEPIERCSRDELEALQLERLAWSLRHAYQNVAPYRLKCDACGAHPNDLRSLADLARFPFTTKQDLREGYPFGLFAVPREQVVRIHASSGTTGKWRTPPCAPSSRIPHPPCVGARSRSSTLRATGRWCPGPSRC